MNLANYHILIQKFIFNFIACTAFRLKNVLQETIKLLYIYIQKLKYTNKND